MEAGEGMMMMMKEVIGKIRRRLIVPELNIRTYVKLKDTKTPNSPSAKGCSS